MVKYVFNLHGQYDSYKLGPKVRTVYVYLVRVGCEQIWVRNHSRAKLQIKRTNNQNLAAAVRAVHVSK